MCATAAADAYGSMSRRSLAFVELDATCGPHEDGPGRLVATPFRPTGFSLFRVQSERDAGHDGQPVSRCSVNPGNNWGDWSHSRFEVILCLVVITIQQIVETQIQFDPVMDLLRNASVKYCEPARYNRGILSIEPIVIDGSHPKRTAPAPPGRKCQRCVRDKVRRAIHVYSLLSPTVKRVGNFRESSVER